MSRAYCTFFDHRYLARGLVMIESLQRVEPGSAVWVLCLDDITHEVISKCGQPTVRAVSMYDLESQNSELVAAKKDGRTLIEYYFTLKPSLVRYVVRQQPGAEFVSYVDADLWFAVSLKSIYDELANHSVLITPHRFSPALRDYNKYGHHNAGWVTFRTDDVGKGCLEWWRQRVNEWCCDVVDDENDRFADQRYLDRFPRLFPRVRVSEHPGINVGPWNAAQSHFSYHDGTLFVGPGTPLIFFHFHGVKLLAPRLFTTADGSYGSRLDGVAKSYLYRPYLRKVITIENKIAPFVPKVRENPRSPERRTVKPFYQLARIGKAIVDGSLIYAAI